ncbi:MAG: arsenate reductase ArsC [Neomegalonema sp.]|nr:arsenate reductase ArsC [Neomegalonema sp.]
MSEKSSLSVLFLCTHNSARSLIAEAILNSRASGVRAYSAGSSPRGEPHKLTIELLRALGHDISMLRSKSWDEFTHMDAPQIDYVVAVCDNAARERCPTLPGKPILANWGVPDPSENRGGAVERRVAFMRAYRQLEQRIDAFLTSEFPSPREADQRTRDRLQGRIDLVGEMMLKPKDHELAWPAAAY